MKVSHIWIDIGSFTIVSSSTIAILSSSHSASFHLRLTNFRIKLQRIMNIYGFLTAISFLTSSSNSTISVRLHYSFLSLPYSSVPFYPQFLLFYFYIQSPCFPLLPASSSPANSIFSISQSTHFYNCSSCSHKIGFLQAFYYSIVLLLVTFYG